MRRGLQEVLLGALKNCGMKWLIRQGIKYLAVPLELRMPSGHALTGPLMGGIFVTYRCNSDCVMCDLVSRHKTPEMSCEQIKRLIDEMVNIGTSGIGFTGGEPLLRDDIFELITYVKQQGIPVTLNTNGILLNNDQIRTKLCQAAPTNINISLDGPTHEIHDTIRGGAGIFEKTVTGARSLAQDLKSTGIRTTLTAVTVISELNAESVESIACLAADIGFHRIGFMPLHEISADRCQVNAAPELSGISSTIRNISHLPLENSPRYLDAIDRAFTGKPFPVRCNAGYTSIFIDPYGRIAPCLGYFQIGKWSSEDMSQAGGLEALWHSQDYCKVRQETMKCRMCYLNCQAELNFLWPEFLS